MSTRPPAIDDRLLNTAVDQFGRFGLEGASTRAIAAAAGTAMSSITYHFGGKEGLYLAAARHIAACIRERLREPVSRSSALAAADGIDAAIDALMATVDGFIGIMTASESAPWARFMVREQMAPTAAFDILYAEVMEGMARHATSLLMRIGGDRLGEQEARLKALAIFGQALVFRVARATVLRTTGWTDITAPETAAIRATVRSHTIAILESIRGDRP